MRWLAALLLLGSCASVGTANEVAHFTGPDGHTVVLSRIGATNTYDLSVRGGASPPQRLSRLDGLDEIRVTPALASNGNSLVLITGRAPGCRRRTVFLATRPPHVETHTLPGCDKEFEVLSQRSGREIIVREARSGPSPVAYVYREGALSAAEPDQKAPAGRPTRSRRPNARGEPLPVPENPPPPRPGVNLDE